MYQPEWYDKWRWEFLDRTPRPVRPLRSSGSQFREEASEVVTEEETLRRTHATWKKQIPALQKRLGFLDRWQTMTQCERMEGDSLGCVYLMRSPRFDAYKIGSTNRDLWVRKNELERVDPNIKYCAHYLTPILPGFLEMAVHRHFRHFHADKNTRILLNELPKEEADWFWDELFNLSEEHAREFWHTTATIEKILLELEVMHLNFSLSKLESDLRKADQQNAG